MNDSIRGTQCAVHPMARSDRKGTAGRLAFHEAGTEDGATGCGGAFSTAWICRSA